MILILIHYTNPDSLYLLTLILLQINPPITLLRQELLGKLFKVVFFQIGLIVLLFSILQVFLAAHSNSGMILTRASRSSPSSC